MDEDKTLANLMEAFLESQANRKYLAYAESRKGRKA